jgi:hypothetical protein
VTNSDGIATVGSWTFGTSGEQRLRASAGVLSVDFVGEVINSVAMTADPLSGEMTLAFGTPTINGRLSSGEWSPTECGSVNVNLPQGGTGPGVFCARNDNEYLYLMLQVNGADPYIGKSFSAVLDENGSNTQGHGDDLFLARAVEQTFFDMFRKPVCDPDCFDHDAGLGGQTHGSFAYGFHGDHHVFEVRKPLGVDDVYDFHRQPGSSIRIWPQVELVTGDSSWTALNGGGGILLNLAGSDPTPMPDIVHFVTDTTTSDHIHTIRIQNWALYPTWLFAQSFATGACLERSYYVLDQAGDDWMSTCNTGKGSTPELVTISAGKWAEDIYPLVVRITDTYTGAQYASEDLTIYGPIFGHVPRGIRMERTLIGGATTYTYEVEIGEDCAITGDWRNCDAWAQDGTPTTLSPTFTSHTHTFSAAATGRWRIVARDGSQVVLNTSPWRYFRFKN